MSDRAIWSATLNKLVFSILLLLLSSCSDFDETKLLAEQGNAIAQNNLGIMYRRGRGVAENYAEAVRWYRLAAEQGNATAQVSLGYMYANGDGVPQNGAEAVKWYRLAAEQGNATAQYNLGYMYANGDGVPQNDVRAYMWYSVTAAQDSHARDNRNSIADLLTPEQLAQGQDMATKCFESNYKNCE